jgi:hypothetical protein
MPTTTFRVATEQVNRPSSPKAPDPRIKGAWRVHGGYNVDPGSVTPPRAAFRPVWQVKSEGERPPLTLFLYIINKYFLDYLFSMTRVLKPHLHLHSSLPLTPALYPPVPLLTPPEAFSYPA